MVQAVSKIKAKNLLALPLGGSGKCNITLILVRSINAKLYRRYLAFYIYLTAVLLIDLLRFSVLILAPECLRPVLLVQ